MIQGLLKHEGMEQALANDGLTFSPLGYEIWQEVFKIDPSSADIRHLNLGNLIKSGSFSITTEMYEQFHAYLSAQDFSQTPQFVASQEGLADIYMYLAQHNEEKQLTEFLSILKEFFDIKVVALVRRQDHFAESFYSHSVRQGYSGDFDEFIDMFPCQHMHWDRLISYFAETLEADEVSVFPFEKPLLEQYANENIASCFMKACGVSSNVNYGVLPVVNPSIAPFAIPVALHANRTLEFYQAYQVNQALAQGCAKPPGSAFSFFSDDYRSEFLATYAESNKILFAKYAPEFPSDSYSISNLPPETLP